MAATIDIKVAVDLSVSGQLDPDQMTFALCLTQAARHEGKWEEFASRVETLLEMAENSSAMGGGIVFTPEADG